MYPTTKAEKLEYLKEKRDYLDRRLKMSTNDDHYRSLERQYNYVVKEIDSLENQKQEK